MDNELIYADINELYKLYDFINKILSDFSCDKKIYDEILIIADEIFSNICNYSGLNKSDKIEIKIEIKKNYFIMEFIDNGMEFNPLLYKAINNEWHKGIIIIKVLADKIEYSYENQKNHLKIYKNLLESNKKSSA